MMAEDTKARFREYQKQADDIAPSLAEGIRRTEVGGTAAATRILSLTMPYYLAQAPKLTAANASRESSAAEFWAPWQAKYLELRVDGMGIGQAREDVAGLLMVEGHEFSDRTLIKWLKG